MPSTILRRLAPVVTAAVLAVPVAAVSVAPATA
jgi:hypothetical protein